MKLIIYFVAWLFGWREVVSGGPLDGVYGIPAQGHRLREFVDRAGIKARFSIR